MMVIDETIDNIIGACIFPQLFPRWMTVFWVRVMPRVVHSRAAGAARSANPSRIFSLPPPNSSNQ